MQQILDRNIKELITEFPAIETVLTTYKIGCTTCAIGTCQLKDIIEIHNLSVADEFALFSNIAAIVFPNEKKEIPKLPRKVNSDTHGKKMSPPLEALVLEHVHIKRVISAIPRVCSSLTFLDDTSKELILSMIDFIKNYADKFHHAKEETILFGMFNASQEIISVMLKEHTTGRGYVKAVVDAVDNNDLCTITDNLTKYAALLTEHIRKEDDILYPWMDRELSDNEVGKLFSKFREVDELFGNKPAEYVKLAHALGD